MSGGRAWNAWRVIFFLPDILFYRHDAKKRKSKKGRKVDALAHGGDEGRDKLR